MLDVAALNIGDTVCAFIRHGEKDAERFVLTQAGKAESIRFGQHIADLNRPVRLYSSPEERCLETAALLAESIAGARSGIQEAAILGKPGIQVKNEEEYSRLIGCKRCRDVYREWKKGLHDDAMHSPAFIRSETLRFVHETMLPQGITIYVSQSGTIACTGYALGVTDYRADDEDWVGYLDGFVLGV